MKPDKSQTGNSTRHVSQRHDVTIEARFFMPSKILGDPEETAIKSQCGKGSLMHR